MMNTRFKLIGLISAVLIIGTAQASRRTTFQLSSAPDGFPVDAKLTDDQVKRWFNYNIIAVSGGHAQVRQGNDVLELIDGPEVFREMGNVIRSASQENQTAKPAIIA